MALKKSMTTEYGFEAPDCYFVIEGVDYQKKSFSSVVMAIYKDKEARDVGVLPFKMCFFSLALDPNLPENLVEQAYAAIKIRPEFEGAVDV